MDSRKLSYQQELCQIQKDSTLPVKAKCCLFVFVDMNLSCAVFISTPEKDGSLECSYGYPFSLWRIAKEVCTSNNSARTAYGKSLPLE